MWGHSPPTTMEKNVVIIETGISIPVTEKLLFIDYPVISIELYKFIIENRYYDINDTTLKIELPGFCTAGKSLKMRDILTTDAGRRLKSAIDDDVRETARLEALNIPKRTFIKPTEIYNYCSYQHDMLERINPALVLDSPVSFKHGVKISVEVGKKDRGIVKPEATVVLSIRYYDIWHHDTEDTFVPENGTIVPKHTSILEFRVKNNTQGWFSWSLIDSCEEECPVGWYLHSQEFIDSITEEYKKYKEEIAKDYNLRALV